MTDKQKLVAATVRLKELDGKLKERDPVTYWPTAFWIASIWISLAFMFNSLTQCVMSVKG